MKTYLLFFGLLLLFVFQAPSQILYGMTSQAKPPYLGVLFSYDVTTGKDTVYVKFDSAHGAPLGNLIEASNGLLYGMVSGGWTGYGDLFSFDPLTSTYTILLSFNDTNGYQPEGSLIQASNGMLYGLTDGGGKYNFGVLLRFDPVTNKDTILINFDSINGWFPFGSLMQASDGMIYGTTYEGGKYSYGTLFRYDPAMNKDTILFNFDSSSGQNPGTTLIQGSDGKLYGMTEDGGAFNVGVIYSFDLTLNKYTTLLNFNYTNGGMPIGSLMQASNGMLYGMAQSYGVHDSGVVFMFDPNSGKDTVLMNCTMASGWNPDGSLMQASNGLIYGMTEDGGNKNAGAILSLDPVSNICSPIFNFDSVNGAAPWGDLMEYHSIITSLSLVTQNNNQASLYPNPSTGDFKLLLTGDGYQSAKIFDEIGREIWSVTPNKELQKQMIDINLCMQPEGIYILQIYSEGKTIMKKLEIQK